MTILPGKPSDDQGSGHTPLAGLPGYAIDREGTVYSVAHNWRGYGARALVPVLNSRGYLRVRLTVAGRRRSHFIHKLVAYAFVGPRPSPRHEVRHLDGNPLRNAVDNIAWGTRTENAADRERHGRTSRGAKHSNAIRAGLRRIA